MIPTRPGKYEFLRALLAHFPDPGIEILPGNAQPLAYELAKDLDRDRLFLILWPGRDLKKMKHFFEKRDERRTQLPNRIMLAGIAVLLDRFDIFRPGTYHVQARTAKRERRPGLLVLHAVLQRNG